jgi:hypothetical protein
VTQRWRKLGPVVGPGGRTLRRAMLPTPFRLADGRLRLYYAALDADMIGRVAFVEIDPSRPTVAHAASPGPALDIGAPGHFDDNGVIPSAAVERGDGVHLYYVGFQKQTRIPYTMLAGLAVSGDGGVTFQRAATTPLLERSTEEPFFRAVPWPLSGPSGWRMWYIGGGEWLDGGGGRLLPSYRLRTLTSADGRSWPGAGTDCLAPVGDEIGFGRPCVVPGAEGYRLWYSIRTRRGYRVSYAESPDGRSWRRLDEQLELGPPLAGLDDEMTCYSAVVAHDERLIMYYNGNGYGRSGIGVAVLEAD